MPVADEGLIMKKDVLISIKGVYNFEDEEQDIVELFTTGQYYKKDGDYYICYDESEATGFDGSKTVLRVEQERQVTMERTGNANTQLIVQNGVRHQCHYDMGFGDMMIGIRGSLIQSTLNDHGGDLRFRYSMDVNSLIASENELIVNVKESASANGV